MKKKNDNISLRKSSNENILKRCENILLKNTVQKVDLVEDVYLIKSGFIGSL